MKSLGLTQLFVVTALTAALVAFAAERPAAAQQLNTDAAKQSYAIGQQVGQQIKQLDAELNLGALIRGIKDTLENRKPALSDKELDKARADFQGSVVKRHKEKLQQQRTKHAAEGKAFLAKNKKQKGVTTTKSGLQYSVLSQGNGKRPTAKSTVKIHYKGTLLDGSEFDSSYARGEPKTVAVEHLVRGWAEGLQLMPVGAKYRFHIPSELAYGEFGNPPSIPANATVILEVELLSIEK